MVFAGDPVFGLRVMCSLTLLIGCWENMGSPVTGVTGSCDGNRGSVVTVAPNQCLLERICRYVRREEGSVRGLPRAAVF
jgi:hypothetical protein